MKSKCFNLKRIERNQCKDLPLGLEDLLPENLEVLVLQVVQLAPKQVNVGYWSCDLKPSGPSGFASGGRVVWQDWHCSRPFNLTFTLATRFWGSSLHLLIGRILSVLMTHWCSRFSSTHWTQRTQFALISFVPLKTKRTSVT